MQLYIGTVKCVEAKVSNKDTEKRHGLLHEIRSKEHFEVFTYVTIYSTLHLFCYLVKNELFRKKCCGFSGTQAFSEIEFSESIINIFYMLMK